MVVGVDEPPARESIQRELDRVAPDLVEGDVVDPVVESRRVYGITCPGAVGEEAAPERLQEVLHCGGSRVNTTETCALSSRTPGSIGGGAAIMAMSAARVSMIIGGAKLPVVLAARAGPCRRPSAEEIASAYALALATASRRAAWRAASGSRSWKESPATRLPPALIATSMILPT